MKSFHQVSSGTRGQNSDIQIHAKEVMNIHNNLNRLLVEHTGQTLATIEKDTDRDNFMSAQQALEYGIVDHVVYKRK